MARCFDRLTSKTRRRGSSSACAALDGPLRVIERLHLRRFIRCIHCSTDTALVNQPQRGNSKREAPTPGDGAPVEIESRGQLACIELQGAFTVMVRSRIQSCEVIVC